MAKAARSQDMRPSQFRKSAPAQKRNNLNQKGLTTMETNNNKRIEVQAINRCLAHNNATRKKRSTDTVYSRSPSVRSDNWTIAAILTIAEEYAADIAREDRKWGALIRKLKLKVE